MTDLARPGRALLLTSSGVSGTFKPHSGLVRPLLGPDRNDQPNGVPQGDPRHTIVTQTESDSSRFHECRGASPFRGR